MSFLRRTWTEIDLDALATNYRSIRTLLRPDCKTMCIVKADAYGHGAVTVARTLEQCGADWFGVSNLEEALQLRRANIQTPIFILGYTPPPYAAKLAEERLTQNAFELDYARALDQAAGDAGVTVDVHIKIDTGMNRLGLVYQSHDPRGETIRAAEEIYRMKHLQATGLFTHFAVSDEGMAGEAFTRAQFGHFVTVRNALRDRGIVFQMHHCSNSGGVLGHPDMQLDMVRPGITLYGLYPSGQVRDALPLRPVMTLKSVVSLVKDVCPGGTVSYGRTFAIEKTMTLATIPIGYADGYPRGLSGKADMLIRGQRAPIVGRVCMDQLVVDATGIAGIQAGDEVTVFGEGLPVDELADLHGTINYEMVCMVGKRVPRVYLRDGRSVGVMDCLRHE